MTTKRATSFLLASLCISTISQAVQRHDGYSPNQVECLAMAKAAADPIVLKSQSSNAVKDLDWKLSVCTSRYAPLSPKGITLMLDAHGHAADEVRTRLEKAIRTLPIEEQAKVWAAFNADQGNGH